LRLRRPSKDTLATWIAVAAVAGLAALEWPWYRTIAGRGIVEGKVYGLAMALALFSAGFTLVARGGLLRVPLLLSAAVATGAVGYYVLRMWRARETIAATLSEAGLPPGPLRGSLEPAAWVALGAALLALAGAILTGLHSTPARPMR
jgi:hypothetical protein